jgi:hypothetical protein
MVLLGGSSGGKQRNGLDVPITTPPTTVSRSATGGASRTPPPSPRTTPAPPSTTPVAGRSGNPCPGHRTCTVAGDGGVIAAIDAYRAAHGRTAVPTAASAAAQTCALHQGADRYCAEHWIWTTVASQSGTGCVHKFSAFNPTWLLDARAKSFSIGWAYAGGTYQCVATKVLSTD